MRMKVHHEQARNSLLVVAVARRLTWGAAEPHVAPGKGERSGEQVRIHFRSFATKHATSQTIPMQSQNGTTTGPQRHGPI